MKQLSKVLLRAGLVWPLRSHPTEAITQLIVFPAVFFNLNDYLNDYFFKTSSLKMLLGSVLLCPGSLPGLLGCAYPEQLGLSSTACGLVLGDFIRLFLHRIASPYASAVPFFASPCRYKKKLKWIFSKLRNIELVLVH